MTDYIKTTGSAGLGKMMIRDVGDGWVEFWFKAGYTSDYWNGMPFNWTANGTTTSKTINYPTGANWYKVGWVYVTTSQTVTFRLTDGSSASGIGGPTSFSQYLERSTVPGAPTVPALSNLTDTSVYVTFQNYNNGGEPFDQHQIGYGTDPNTAQNYPISDGSDTISGLTPGTVYYFWARSHNVKGWGPWSGQASVKTLKVPDAPTVPLLAAVRMTSVDVAFTGNSDNGSPILEYQIGFGTNSASPTSTVSATSPMTVTGLTPGTLLYFRTRARNVVGWGPWSAASSIKTIAGAYVKVGAEWKLAVPYVRVGGVWKLAEPWVRSVGVWKRTT